jgi:hypothetical protein
MEGRRVSSASAESVMNHLINRRLSKRQQMRWSMHGANYLHRPASSCSMEDWNAAFETDTRTSGHPRSFGVERTRPHFSSAPGNCQHQHHGWRGGPEKSALAQRSGRRRTWERCRRGSYCWGVASLICIEQVAVAVGPLLCRQQYS